VISSSSGSQAKQGLTEMICKPFLFVQPCSLLLEQKAEGDFSPRLGGKFIGVLELR